MYIAYTIYLWYRHVQAVLPLSGLSCSLYRVSYGVPSKWHFSPSDLFVLPAIFFRDFERTGRGPEAGSVEYEYGKNIGKLTSWTLSWTIQP